MKKLPSTLLLSAALLFGGAMLLAQPAEKKAPSSQPKKQKAPPLPGAGTGGNTPHATTSTVIGPNRADGNRVTIIYGRPNVKHPRTGEVRKVWGKLEAWDKPYRLGADEATVLITQKALQIGDATIPAGAYTLYLVPSQSGTSKLAFSKKLGDWGVPVDVTQDLVRVDAKKDSLPSVVEQLTLTVENGPPQSHSGTIKIAWDDTQFSVPFTVKR